MPNKTLVHTLLLVWLCTWAKLMAGIPVLRPLQARMQSSKIWALVESLSDSQWLNSAGFLSHPCKVRPSEVFSIWHCANLGESLFCQSVATPLYLPKSCFSVSCQRLHQPHFGAVGLSKCCPVYEQLCIDLLLRRTGVKHDLCYHIDDITPRHY